MPPPPTPPSSQDSYNWRMGKPLFANIDAKGVKSVWYTERLWELAKGLTPAAVPIASISAFDEVTWFGLQDPTCRRVTEHAKRIADASFEHPVILSEEGWVMDGMHRVCKAFLSGQETVQAVRFSPNPEPDERVPVTAGEGVDGEAKRLIAAFGLSPHPEGGAFRESYRSAEATPQAGLPPRFTGPRALSTAIYFLLPEGSRSRLHRIKSDEVWHFYLGGPLLLIEISPEGAVREVVLGRDYAAGQKLQHVVAAGAWFGSIPQPGAGFSFVGCTVAPGFDFADFELGESDVLHKAFPQARAAIELLT